ncbi:prolyl oligopeptidase family serine peptidase [Rhizobium sp. 21-4511-3d]
MRWSGTLPTSRTTSLSSNASTARRNGRRCRSLTCAARTLRSLPDIACGYGAFGIPRVPYANPIHLAWVEQGGVMAIAGIRGGGEYGGAWHRAPERSRISRIRFTTSLRPGGVLKKSGITSSDGLAIQGESNGSSRIAE